MWILGIVVYYLFHRVAFVYYLGIFAKGSMQRPVASMYRWFHWTMYALSGILFITSCCLFYLSAPWLTITPFVLLGVSWIVLRIKHGRRMDSVIKKAAEIQVQMERKGLPQTEINKAIYLGATGKLYNFESDSNLKTFLKYSILSEVFGLDATEDLVHAIEKSDDPKYVSRSAKIDAAVDEFYQYWRKK